MNRFVWFANWKSASLSARQLATDSDCLAGNKGPSCPQSDVAAVISLGTLAVFSNSHRGLAPTSQANLTKAI